MKNDDVELIRRTLAGDETAFTTLVKKYHKHIHALAWRKIGDFHIAEDITQETFLRAYRHLATLKKPERFPGWLYVIATRRCIAWLRKKRLHTELVEDIDVATKGKDTYSGYIAEEQAKTTRHAQQEVVKKLLAKLQESERTVITLHYFGEMTCEEISKFLGVSPNTIKSRLSRARKRLRKEESLIREALSSFQISPHLIENITREVRNITPVSATSSKPVIPWAVAASTALLAVFVFGISSEYLARFQQPYSLAATSEIKIDIVETPLKPLIKAKPATRTQLGKKDASGKDSRSTPQPDTRHVIATQTLETETLSESTQQMQIEVLDFFRTPEAGHHDYTLVRIDATAFENGGMLTIDIRVGSGKAAGSFDLFSGDSEVSRKEHADDALAHEYGIPPGGTGFIAYRFDRGQVFQLGVTGDWWSEVGSINAFHALISIR